MKTRAVKSRAVAKKTSKAPTNGKSPIVKGAGTKTRRNLAKPAKSTRPETSEAATDSVMAAAVAEAAIGLRALKAEALKEEAAQMSWITPAAPPVKEQVREASAVAAPIALAPQIKPRAWTSIPMYVFGFASLGTLWMTISIFNAVSHPIYSAAAAIPAAGPRPYVQIAATTMENFIPGQRPSVTFRIKNSGQTPMFITEREVGMTDGAWSSIALHGPATNTGLMDIGVGETADISGFYNQVLSRPALEQIIAGKKALRAFMRVEYQDNAGVKHHAIFSREYDAARSRALKAPVFMFPHDASLMASD